MNLMKKLWPSSKDKNRAGDFGSPQRIICTVILVFITSQFLAALLVEIFIGVTTSSTNPDGALPDSAPAQFFYLLFAEGGAVWIVLRVLKSRGLSLAKIGLGRRPNGGDIVKALIGFASFFGIIVVVNIVLGTLFPELNSQKQDVGFHNLNSSIDYFLAFMALVILPPIGEEVLVRGYLYSGLRSHWKLIPAMIVTSLFFGLAHLQLGSGAAVLWAAGINTFVLSLVLVYLRERSGALYAGMLVHSLNNFLAFSVYLHH